MVVVLVVVVVFVVVVVVVVVVDVVEVVVVLVVVTVVDKVVVVEVAFVVEVVEVILVVVVVLGSTDTVEVVPVVEVNTAGHVEPKLTEYSVTPFCRNRMLESVLGVTLSEKSTYGTEASVATFPDVPLGWLYTTNGFTKSSVRVEKTNLKSRVKYFSAVAFKSTSYVLPASNGGFGNKTTSESRNFARS